MYFALVSPHWNPNGANHDNMSETLNYKCFSLWHFRDEITTEIRNIAAAPQTVSNNLPPQFSTNGYYGKDKRNIYYSEKADRQWIEYDFGRCVEIRKIIVKARHFKPYPSHFGEVEIKVGNISSSVGNFQTSTLMYYYDQVAFKGEILVFDTPVSLFGRYLSLQSTDSYNRLVIGTISIIGHVDMHLI